MGNVCRCPECGADVGVYERATVARIVAWLRADVERVQATLHATTPEAQRELAEHNGVILACADLIEEGAWDELASPASVEGGR